MVDNMVLLITTVVSFLLGNLCFSILKKRSERKEIESYFKERDERLKKKLDLIRRYNNDVPVELKLRKDKGEYIRRRV